MIRGSGQILCLALLVHAGLTFGCVFNLADVKYRPARLDAAENYEVPFTLAADTPIHGAPCGYPRTLRKDTRWDPVGRLVEGVVYRSQDQTLTLECSNVFEAYLVVAEQRLVGFYLPVEKGFSPLGEPTQLAVSGQR
jgi:hypothetical protein